ncbi:hypothetical protein RP20_CCG027043 [Aedes albopictus]|nr:hypothetical protein RP20_CCG027043 [Aedes albopictus]
MTIPRLELCGTLLLARLVEKTSGDEHPFFQCETPKLHTDSQVCLSWLAKSPLVLNQFVANRVATVHELTQDYNWRYVWSQDNPADIISRGVLPAELLTEEQWLKGAPTLWHSNSPNEKILCLDDSELPELKPMVVATAFFFFVLCGLITSTRRCIGSVNLTICPVSPFFVMVVTCVVRKDSQ